MSGLRLAKTWESKRRQLWSGLLAAGILPFVAGGQLAAARAVTVDDSIVMTRLAQEATFSPDGKQFVLILKQGNLENNTTEFSALLFQTSAALRSPQPQRLLVFASSSNRDAIKDLKWLNDNRTISFIGEQPGEMSQIYLLDIKTGKLERRTRHPTPITTYDIAADGRRLVFAAEPEPIRIADTQEARRQGIVVDADRSTWGKLLGEHARPAWNDYRLFVQQDDEPVVAFRLQEDDLSQRITLSLSPDGNFVLIDGSPRNIPSLWSGYENDWLRMRVGQAARHPGRSSPFLRRFSVIDIEKKTVTPVLNTPTYTTTVRSRALWSEHGRSVFVMDALLPLDVSDPMEKEARRAGQFDVEVELDGRGYRKVSKEQLPRDGTAKLDVRISLSEDLNSPPTIQAYDRRSGVRALLLDPNPQFAALSFGKVQAIAWQTAGGRAAKGGLYLPPDYEAGKRYPLVIQTHGFDPGRFEIDGSPLASAYAAQALAGKGFLVVQAGELSVQDGALELQNYEGAIDYLDRRGMVDLERLGIVGFSSTVYTAGYAVINSKYRFAAASLVDGVDGGYVNYILFMSPDIAAVNGGPPFGEGLTRWMKESPGFNLERFDAPLRLVALGGPVSLLAGWQWFSGLSLLQKPVYHVYLPDAAHMVVKPWERKVAQEGLVDWFCFWLQGQEDPHPTKAEQYRRWRELRAGSLR